MRRRSELTLYTHHSLADAHHQFALLEKLFGWYTDIVSGAGVGPVKAEPIPESLESVLSERGIGKLLRFGLERYLPAMFAYDLPPSHRNAGRVGPQSARVPSATCRLSHQESQDLIDICAARRVSLNALVAAAILLAEWTIRDTPHLPIPYMYPVDLRFFLTPPVGATQATNPVGMAMYLAEINPNTDIMELARDIVEAFRADLADGVIQQSFLHFGSQYQGNPPGLPDVVMTTDGGELPPLRTPPGLTIDQYDVEVLFAATSAGVDMYSAATYDGGLVITYHSHGPDPRSLCQRRFANCWLPSRPDTGGSRSKKVAEDVVAQSISANNSLRPEAKPSASLQGSGSSSGQEVNPRWIVPLNVHSEMFSPAP